MKINLSNAIIEKVQTMADKSIQLRIAMPELPVAEMVGIFEAVKEGVVEIDMEAEAEIKTPSKQLRDALFVYYKHSSGTEEGFNSWYASELRKIKQEYLDKII